MCVCVCVKMSLIIFVVLESEVVQVKSIEKEYLLKFLLQ